MKIHKLLMIIVAFLISSCGTGEPSVITKFVVKNNSNHHIYLNIYRFETNYYSQVDTIFNIPTNSEIKFGYGGNIGSGVYPFPFGIDVDSAYIVFDNSSRIIYRKNDLVERNILDIESYAGGKIDDQYFEYIYTITDEDYANALEIK